MSIALPVLAHRLILSPDAQLREETIEQVVERTMSKVKPPLGVGDREPAAAS
jgi:MoxR-like ATPase